MKRKSFKSSAIAEDLQDSEFAAAYLEQALEEDVSDFLIALRNVADANGGIGLLAKQSALGRESLYKTLASSGESNPQFATIQQILNALGLKLAIEPKKEAA